MEVYILTNLHSLIIKATHECLPCPEPDALETFCAMVRETQEAPELAARLLASRIHSANPKEALLALTMLDRCMCRCNSKFHSEIGKFRFLNEMIKLVSPKYFADRTAPEVQKRVLQLLHAWSIEYRHESKFKVAYDMLKSQGVVKETPPPLPPEDAPPYSQTRPKNAVFEDEEKSKLLKKLLQSKKPEDLQHANRLIKTMVREEERRSEANSRRAQEVGAALDSAGLLRDMLDHASETSADEEQLIHELHASCLKMKPVLHKLAASETQPENLDDILHASDVLDEVFEIYNAFIIEKKQKTEMPKVERQTSQNNALLDFAGLNVNKTETDSNNVSNKNTFDELGDIFTAEVTSRGSSITEPLKPVNLMPCDADDAFDEKNNKKEGWNELDSLGKKLLQQSLPEHARRTEGFNNKSAKKIPMNALEKNSPKHTPELNNGTILDLDFFTRPKVNEQPIPSTSKLLICKDDDLMVDISDGEAKLSNNQFNDKCDVKMNDNPINPILDLSVLNQNTPECNKLENNLVRRDSNKTTKVTELKPLTDIYVTLVDVTPSKIPPLVAFQEEEDGVTVVLHFCKDKPRPDVNVIVVSTTSKNSSPIEDYKFQSVVPKGCKVRLLTPSGTTLPPYNPFLPPPALTQVMLIARPPSPPPLDLKFVITYMCNDDVCSEIGEVKHLPLDDI